MKLRQFYVTNSSSSSFILAFKDDYDIERFKFDCDSYYYEDFFKLINDLSGDFLTFSNDSREEISIRPLIDRIKNRYWGMHASMELDKLYVENYKLKPWETVSVQLNKFGDNEVNLEELDFEEIEEEGKYTIDITNNKARCDKNAAIEDLRWQYAAKYISEILDEKFKRNDFETFDEYMKARDDYRKTDEYKKLIDDSLKETDFNEKKEQIENAQLVVSGMIWDTSGGLLEWAIRNGFIEDNFYGNCVICYNVG